MVDKGVMLHKTIYLMNNNKTIYKDSILSSIKYTKIPIPFQSQKRSKIVGKIVFLAQTVSRYYYRSHLQSKMKYQTVIDVKGVSDLQHSAPQSASR